MLPITLRGFVRKELSQALRDPRMRGMLFIMPVLQLLLFGFALSSEIRNIRLAVVARPDEPTRGGSPTASTRAAGSSA